MQLVYRLRVNIVNSPLDSHSLHGLFPCKWPGWRVHHVRNENVRNENVRFEQVRYEH